MELPRERNQRVWEKVMPFLSYFEEREQEAQKQGAKSGLLEGIQVVLQLRLPEQEKTLLARAERVDDLELLRRVLKAASAADVEQLNRLLP
jgi:hypothetical protein